MVMDRVMEIQVNYENVLNVKSIAIDDFEYSIIITFLFVQEVV